MQAALVTLCSAKVNQLHEADASRFGHTTPAKVIRLLNTDASPFGHAMLCKGHLVTQCRCTPLWSHDACKGHSVTQYRCKPLWLHYALQRSFGYTIPMQAPLVTLCSAKVIRLHNADATAIVSLCRQGPAPEWAVKSHGCNTIAFQR